MYHLLAAALIFAFGAATTLATAKVLHQWAAAKYDASEIVVDIAARPGELRKSANR